MSETSFPGDSYPLGCLANPANLARTYGLDGSPKGARALEPDPTLSSRDHAVYRCGHCAVRMTVPLRTAPNGDIKVPSETAPIWSQGCHWEGRAINPPAVETPVELASPDQV